MISKSLFGNRLKEQRKKLGFTQAQAAEKAGIERETWGKYERGVFMPSGDVLISFLSMGINVSDLFAIEETFKLPENSTSELNKEETKLLTQFRQLNQDGKTAIFSMLSALLPKKATENHQIQEKYGTYS